MNWSMSRTNEIDLERFNFLNCFQHESAERTHDYIKVIFKRFGISFIEIAKHFSRTIMSSEYIAGEQYLIFDKISKHRIGPMQIWSREKSECFIPKIKRISILYNHRFERFIDNIFEISDSITASYDCCGRSQFEKKRETCLLYTSD